LTWAAPLPSRPPRAAGQFSLAIESDFHKLKKFNLPGKGPDHELFAPRFRYRLRLSRRGHSPGRMVRQKAEQHHRLFSRRPRPALAGHLHLGGRHGDQCADLHQHPRAGLPHQPQLSPDRGRLSARPHCHLLCASAPLLPRGDTDRIPPARQPLRLTHAQLFLDCLPAYAPARRRRPPLRRLHPSACDHGLGLQHQHHRHRHGHHRLHLHRRHPGRGLAGRAPMDGLYHRRRPRPGGDPRQAAAGVAKRGRSGRTRQQIRHHRAGIRPLPERVLHHQLYPGLRPARRGLSLDGFAWHRPADRSAAANLPERPRESKGPHRQRLCRYHPVRSFSGARPRPLRLLPGCGDALG